MRGGFGARCLAVMLGGAMAPIPPAAGAFSYPDGLAGSDLVRGDFLDESFEEISAFPPTSWMLLARLGSIYTWHAGDQSPFVRTGGGSAMVRWQDGELQDERLRTPPLDLSTQIPEGLFLSFWWYTDPFWFNASPNHFQVRATLDGASWDLVWSSRGYPESGWAWRNTLVDLSPYAGVAGEFQLEFRYRGQGAADLAIDDVKLGYLAPPAPPENDDCLGALANGFTIGPAPGSFQLTGNNVLATNDYPLGPGSCTGFSHSGKDLVWVIELAAGHSVTATMTTAGGWDDTLFVLGDCANPMGSCLVGARGFPDGATVTVTNSSNADVRHWLVASSHSTGAGDFTIQGSIQLETALERESWGRVKARYR